MSVNGGCCKKNGRGGIVCVVCGSTPDHTSSSWHVPMRTMRRCLASCMLRQHGVPGAPAPSTTSPVRALCQLHVETLSRRMLQMCMHKTTNVNKKQAYHIMLPYHVRCARRKTVRHGNTQSSLCAHAGCELPCWCPNASLNTVLTAHGAMLVSSPAGHSRHV